MELPQYSVVCILLAFVVLCIAGKPGKGATFLSILLLLVAAGPSVYKSVSRSLADESVPNMVLK